jgi:hypothetical protein
VQRDFGGQLCHASGNSAALTESGTEGLFLDLNNRLNMVYKISGKLQEQRNLL